MKLHRWALVVALGASMAPAGAGATDAGPPPAAADPLDVVTASGLEALRARLAGLVVAVRRVRPPLAGLTVPGGRVLEGGGLLVAAGRVITARALVEGWPEGADDRLEVRAANDAWRSAAVGLDDRPSGLAVLDVPHLPPPALRTSSPGPRVTAGRRLYALSAPDAPLRPVAVRARGEGPLAWYWVADGWTLPLGTPLATPAGEVVALVGLRLPDDPPDRLLLLPPESLQDLFARSAQWMP